MQRKKIRVVMADPGFLISLGLWEQLAKVHDVCLCILVPKSAYKIPETSVNMKLFEEISDMQGYLRGLEDELSGSDIVFSFQTVHLSTFQAIRSGLRFGFPVSIIAEDFEPFAYQSYPNLRAIQTDVHEHAASFLCLSSYTQDVLRAEGVQPERIRAFNIPLVMQDGPRRLRQRDKFRKYIDLRADEQLVTWLGHGTTQKEVPEILRAVHQLKRINPVTAQQTRLLFVMPQPEAEEFKYLAHDLGLARQVLFMHQDINQFKHDLFAASDAVIAPWTHSYKGYPCQLVDAVQQGASAIVAQGSFVHQLLGASALTFQPENPLGLVQALQQIGEHRQNTQALGGSSAPGQAINEIMQIISAAEVAKEAQGDTAQSLLSKLEKAVNANQLNEAKIFAEDLSLRLGGQHPLMTQVHVLKGHVALAEREWERAMDSFSDALGLQPRNIDALLGLGQICFHTQSYEEAQRFYRKVLSADPNCHHAFLGLGLMNQKIQDFEEALFWLKKALENQKSQVLALTAIIQIALELGDAYESVRLLEDIRDSGIDTTNLKIALGQCYIRTGNVEAGKDLINQAIAQGAVQAA